MYPHVESKTDAQNLWRKLKVLYHRQNKQNKACLIWNLVNIKYKDGDSMV